MKKLKIALTGRLRVGKDYVANAAQGTILSFADPLYALGEYLVGRGVEYKDRDPFLREFYQKIGQWGRGDVNEQYPLTMERALFTAWVLQGHANKVAPYVDWEKWGSGGDIWLDALLRRAAQVEDSRIFVTNCRYKNEYDALLADGWDHWHVICSRQTYEERLRLVNMSINDKRLLDQSERLAGALDSAVINMIKQEPVGPKMKVIWNDARPSPCDRLQTVDQFMVYLENQQTEPEYINEPEPTDPIGTPAAYVEAGGGHGEESPAPERAGGVETRDAAERRRNRKLAAGN